MKTFYALLLSMSVLATFVILLSAASIVWQCALISIVIVLTWREFRAFSVQSIALHGDKILVTECGQTYAATYQMTSIVARHLCFLYLQALDEDKRWRIPVSRLEFSAESFRKLKGELQCFLMR